MTTHFAEETRQQKEQDGVWTKFEKGRVSNIGGSSYNVVGQEPSANYGYFFHLFKKWQVY